MWCAREDLNLQSFRNQILSLARLPVPPRALVMQILSGARGKLKPVLHGAV